MELKVACDCGQKYAFDVEPVGGRMPMSVNCPACGADGTAAANGLLAQNFPNEPAPLPVAATAVPIAGGLRVSTPPSPLASRATMPPANASRPTMPLRPGMNPPKVVVNDFSLGLGILGAIIGAAIGGALMYAFYAFAGFRFPITGVIIGICTGFGARILGRGTDTSLGVISATIAVATVSGVLYLMYGDVFLGAIISIAVCGYVGYRTAA